MSGRPALTTTVAGLLVACLVAVGVAQPARASAPALSATAAPGARALDDPQYADVDWSAVDRVDALRPAAADVRTDTPKIYRTECPVGRNERDFQVCTFGAKRADRTVVLVGDSKALQWFTPVDRIAKRAHWRLVVITKVGCPFADVIRPVDGRRNRTCEAWGRRALAAVERLRPEIVLTVTRWGSALPPDGLVGDPLSGSAMVAGLARYWRQVQAAGARLVPILDTPGPPDHDAPGCVERNSERLSSCVYPTDVGVESSGAPAQRAAAARVRGVRPVDMTSTVCPDERCPAVIGNVSVYRSGTHLSDTYATSAMEALARRLEAATRGLIGAR